MLRIKVSRGFTRYSIIVKKKSYPQQTALCISLIVQLFRCQPAILPSKKNFFASVPSRWFQSLRLDDVARDFFTSAAHLMTNAPYSHRRFNKPRHEENSLSSYLQYAKFAKKCQRLFLKLQFFLSFFRHPFFVAFKKSVRIVLPGVGNW